jgi:radical SAM superfamily enzyme YgiQ (UPF0313 family)
MAPPSSWALRERLRALVRDEEGTLYSNAERRIALAYPSPYHVGMSSLGFQTIYRQWNQREDWGCERFFLPDDVAAHRRARAPVVSCEAERPLGDFPVIALSVAYELELAGVVELLELGGVPPLAESRDERHPLVVAGGPLTFSNPVPLGPFVDVVLLGEAEQTAGELLDAVDGAADRPALLARLAGRPGFWVPSIHGERLPPIARADDELLPARSQILTPHTELASMFLIEPERGCSRGCTYCVMRRSTNGGMRLVAPEKLMALVPERARKVGLVGAAVTDHPKLAAILRALVDSGRQIGISSLRADRLDDEIVSLLARGGYHAITFASDGASERLRAQVERKTKERHLLAAAGMAAQNGMSHVKVYQMVGLPGETDEDLDELARFTREMAKRIKIVLGVAPFVAKRNTPLDGAPYAGVREVEEKLGRLKRALAGAAELRPTSARWAWVEHRLAQGGFAEGRAVLDACHQGGGFAAWKRALGEAPPTRLLNVVQ